VQTEAEAPPAGGPARALRLGLEVVALAVLAVVIAFVLQTVVAQAFYIPSGSMEPQLEVGDRVVVSKVSYRLHEPRRGDIVVFDSPLAVPGPQPALPVRMVERLLQAVGVQRPGDDEYIKRVVALPGETVAAVDGRVHIDGRPLVEPYLPAGTMTGSFGPEQVPEGQLWVMGDNRANSADSRRFGPVPRDEVVGRAILRIWPPGRAAFI
jgi:signal peptidase I